MHASTRRINGISENDSHPEETIIDISDFNVAIDAIELTDLARENPDDTWINAAASVSNQYDEG